MATSTIKIDPVTRLEGHLEVTLSNTDGVVSSAKSGGMLFRGFENLLIGKLPQDAIYITQRICGVCPISHAMASCLAVEKASRLTPPENARIIRNLILGAEFLQSHILHFYHLVLLSYIKGPEVSPWAPAWDIDQRFSPADNQVLVEHYLQALSMRRQAHEMAAIFGGKMPHTAAFEAGGVLVGVDRSMIDRFINYLDPLISFIDNVYTPDVDLLGSYYPEYYSLGRGYGNLLAFGVFDLNSTGSKKLFRSGRVANGSGTVNSIVMSAIMEQTEYSWYQNSSRNPAQGLSQPLATKAGAYSWIKAPRYNGAPYETGPLARMWINGDYRRGISVMDRHHARVLEASKIAHAMHDWVDQINPAGISYKAYTLPATGVGIGLTEAPRGALGHWVTINTKKIKSYQVLTPTCWNCSPMDNKGVPGPLEKALQGTPVTDESMPIEALRVIQSYDPCLACAVH